MTVRRARAATAPVLDPAEPFRAAGAGPGAGGAGRSRRVRVRVGRVTPRSARVTVGCG